MLLLIAVAQQAAHPCIMPPNGSTTGNCQSQDSGICNLREAKHFASVSPLLLTQHIAKGKCPAVQDLQWSLKRNAEWREVVLGAEHTQKKLGKFKTSSFGETALCRVLFKASSISSLVSFQQMTKYPHRANTHRVSWL